MNIDDYVPTNFDPDKFHALKCLWLYNRKYELFIEYFEQVPPGDVEAFKRINPVISSVEQLQRETGMTREDIHYFTLIGGYIQEYIEMLDMTPEELQEHIDNYEADPIPLDPEDQASIDEMWQDIAHQINQKNQIDQQFGNIIHVNFNDQEKRSDG